jgi:uncharacterized protein (DUF2342 family)
MRALEVYQRVSGQIEPVGTRPQARASRCLRDQAVAEGLVGYLVGALLAHLVPKPTVFAEHLRGRRARSPTECTLSVHDIGRYTPISPLGGVGMGLELVEAIANRA